MANFLITYVFWWYLSIQSARSEIDHILKLKQRFSKCTVIMGRDHGHPYILSTTVLSDNIHVHYDTGDVAFDKHGGVNWGGQPREREVGLGMGMFRSLHGDRQCTCT